MLDGRLGRPRRWSARGSRGGAPRGGCHRCPPALEALEARLTPATLTVLTTADALGVVTPTGTDTYTASTLRAAIDFANANPDQDLITFAPSLAHGTILLGASDTRNPFTVGPTAFVITTEVAIDAGNLGITLSGQGSRRLFGVLPTGNLALKGLTLTSGAAVGGAGAMPVCRSRVVMDRAEAPVAAARASAGRFMAIEAR